ncbi:MAG TPA: peptidoglycan DD-metalloendopeptidase family protein [Candidatus Dormibacteraeota bacterium]|nr:peptidoglycan DD-metalloendopeptidase family protein [Candidatus Dormibacteraeota bacterium]
MKRGLVTAAVLIGLFSLQTAAAGATTPSNSACPSPGSASNGRVTCPPPAVDPNQAAYDLLKSRLSGDIGRALDAEQKLSSTLDQFASVSDALTNQVTQEETLIAQLQDAIAALDSQIADTEERIDTEKDELATMSRAIYRQPTSLWLLIARSGSLQEALHAAADAVVAGQRAHALQVKLEADLAKLQSDREARQNDLDREQSTHDLLVANLDSLQEVISRQSDVNDQLDGLVAQIKDAKDQLTNQPPDVTAALAQLLEAQEQDLILRSYDTAWTMAQVGTGLALVNHTLPVGKTISGLALSWPLAHFTITQPFGPSTVLLEPPLGPYRHFHTGVDISAPLGTPVMAAADGIVVAVGQSNIGYGNYVVIAHGGGVATLYGHLLQANAHLGDAVLRGQVIGLEGSTGLSTGPHVHFELRVNDQVTDPMPYLPVPGTNWSG